MKSNKCAVAVVIVLWYCFPGIHMLVVELSMVLCNLLCVGIGISIVTKDWVASQSHVPRQLMLVCCSKWSALSHSHVWMQHDDGATWHVTSLHLNPQLHDRVIAVRL